MKWLLLAALFTGVVEGVQAQVSIESIQADYVTEGRRKAFDAYLRDTAIAQVFNDVLDSESEYGFAAACDAALQFMIRNQSVETGFSKLFSQYNTLQYSSQLSFLEAVYGLYPGVYKNQVRVLISKETQPKLFAMQAVYLLASDETPQTKAYLLSVLNTHFAKKGAVELLLQLRDYILNHSTYTHQHLPDITELFNNQQALQQKVIYSFQRWNRDYPGLAVLQNADGSFARDSAGKLLVFQQLARSASNLPYFITDGNTPQGIYSITGIQVSSNHLLGPTPTIKMVMPFEDNEAYWGDTYDNTKDILGNYLALLPAAWQQYKPMEEAFYAGKVGRTAVIAHGTTLNPVYFYGKTYYPISPTLGCLCAREIWDAATGKLKESEQLRLVNAFNATADNTGYAIVINLDNKKQPVSAAEVEALVQPYEALRLKGEAQSAR